MKTFLVVAGLLMTGASVYGIVDYNKKAESKEFKELYKETPEETEVVKAEAVLPVAGKKEVAKIETAAATEKPVAKKTVKKKVAKKKKRSFELKEFSRGRLE